MLVKTDTIVTFNPETYEQTTEIKRREINADSIHELRLIQTWYWDDKRHRLSIHLEGVAPMVDVLNDMEEVKYSKPMFYRRSKR